MSKKKVQEEYYKSINIENYTINEENLFLDKYQKNINELDILVKLIIYRTLFKNKYTKLNIDQKIYLR